MDRPQLIRRLRIAASVFFAVVAVALCMLWVRSYWQSNILFRVDSNGMLTTFGSNSGYAYLVRRDISRVPLLFKKPHGWKLDAGEAYSTATSGSAAWPELTRQKGTVTIPYWCLVAVLAGAAAIPVLPTRFSLRTLLIATTLVAVVLGLGVWAAG
jgi:hypothetical protein